MKVESDVGYMEGVWAGERMPKYISQTTYKTIEGAILSKEEVIRNFETVFGYSREMNVTKFDYNYSYNLGILDALKKLKNQ